MKIPEWLDDLIFNQMGAIYCPSHSDMTNIHDDKEKTLNYLGTYFPRSYAESYNIFSDFFSKHHQEWINRKELSIFDFGSGTGGEVIGFLTVLNEKFSNIEKVRIVAIDGNDNAILNYSKIIANLQSRVSYAIINNPAKVNISNIEDLKLLGDVMVEEFDIIMSFKTICEFVSEDKFDSQNPYETIIRFMLPKLRTKGIVLIEDITTKNDKSDKWLPEIMDKGLNNVGCDVFEKNDNYNQKYYITHSQKQNDITKVAWRIIKS